MIARPPMRRSLVVTVISAVCFARFLFGQAASGTITGTVTDNSGAVVPEVSVTLVNEATGFTRTISTNQNGQYVAEFFPIGSVRITAAKAGFTKLERRGIT